MGIAAYNRGSALISCQISREAGRCTCERCNPYVPTPRPDNWGEKIQAKLDEAAERLNAYLCERPWWDLDTMIEMLEREYPKASKKRVQETAERYF